MEQLSRLQASEQMKTTVGRPCFNSHCECPEDKCSHPNFYDSRGKFDHNNALDVDALRSELEYLMKLRGIKGDWRLNFYMDNIVIHSIRKPL